MGQFRGVDGVKQVLYFTKINACHTTHDSTTMADGATVKAAESPAIVAGDEGRVTIYDWGQAWRVGGGAASGRLAVSVIR